MEIKMPEHLIYKMPPYKSIIQHGQYCFNCGSGFKLDKHHVFNKYNKKRSEKYGMMVYLCRNCHSEVHDRPTGLRRKLEQYAQTIWERHYGTRDEFIKEFGKSYL